MDEPEAACLGVPQAAGTSCASSQERREVRRSGTGAVSQGGTGTGIRTHLLGCCRPPSGPGVYSTSCKKSLKVNAGEGPRHHPRLFRERWLQMGLNNKQ